jgi:uncharacterized protein YjbJ (UPF0337 family)
MTDAKLDQAKGDIKTVAGQVTGDKRLEAQGRTESATAGLRQDADRAWDSAQKTARDVADKTQDALRDMAGKAGDVAKDLSSKASDVADDVANKAKEVVSR